MSALTDQDGNEDNILEGTLAIIKPGILFDLISLPFFSIV
jgi:hypothetical protein